MTEFEKHEGSICDSIKVDCPSCGCDRCTEIQKAGWKKALEWVKSRSDYSKELYMIWANDIDDELGT